MVRTNSTMLPLGTELPPFKLPIVSIKSSLADFDLNGLDFLSNEKLGGKPILVMVICAHCPFVKHIEVQLTKIDQDYSAQVQIIAISSNSVITHPQDGPEQLRAQALENKWSFPYLFDEDQLFAKALQAACTPDFFLFSSFKDGKMRLRYRGQLDGSRPGNELLVDGADLRFALEAVLHGREVCTQQKPSIGCNIKWHPGKEPFWFL